MTRERRDKRRSRSEQSGNLYLLSGIVIGILAGLVISWVIAPATYRDTTPASLRADFKETYRSLIASAFYATGNLERASSRLDLLKDSDPALALTIQAQSIIDSGDLSGTAFQLAYLADALKRISSPLVETSTSLSALETPEPTEISTTPDPFSSTSTQTGHTPTVLILHTPTSTPAAQFILVSNKSDCDENKQPLLLRIDVIDSAGKPLPAIELILSWATNEEHFYTGLKPEINPGYADFLMTPGISYKLQVGSSGTAGSNLTAPICSTQGDKIIWGGIILQFQRK